MRQLPYIFNRHLLRKRRNRATRYFYSVDFLKTAMVERLGERLQHMRRSFNCILDMGSHTGALAQALQGLYPEAYIVRSDIAFSMAEAGTKPAIVMDEEYMAFSKHSFDLVVSAGTLQCINDFPGCLVQLCSLLRSGGLCMVTFPGENTLHELRHVLAETETRLYGGVSPRVMPCIEVKALGQLLQRAGFQLPVTDTEKITLSYPDLFTLYYDLRKMGETSILGEHRRGFDSRFFFQEADKLYKQVFPDDQEGIIATIELLTMTGIAP